MGISYYSRSSTLADPGCHAPSRGVHNGDSGSHAEKRACRSVPPVVPVVFHFHITLRTEWLRRIDGRKNIILAASRQVQTKYAEILAHRSTLQRRSARRISSERRCAVLQQETNACLVESTCHLLRSDLDRQAKLMQRYFPPNTGKELMGHARIPLGTSGCVASAPCSRRAWPWTAAAPASPLAKSRARSRRSPKSH